MSDDNTFDCPWCGKSCHPDAYRLGPCYDCQTDKCVPCCPTCLGNKPLTCDKCENGWDDSMDGYYSEDSSVGGMNYDAFIIIDE